MSPNAWLLDFTDEVKFYFIDSGAYTGNLLGEIHLLAYANDPREGCTEMPDEPGVWMLAMMDHKVYFTFEKGLIRIIVVKPD
jgi:hypothetical protein